MSKTHLTLTACQMSKYTHTYIYNLFSRGYLGVLSKSTGIDWARTWVLMDVEVRGWHQVSSSMSPRHLWRQVSLMVQGL